MMVNLFEKDAYIKEFETIIQNIDKENKTIELENTAFYAKAEVSQEIQDLLR